MPALSAPADSTFTLVAEALILAGLYVGFYFALRREFKHHQYIQSAMVLLNLVLILRTMIPSFYRSVARGGASGPTDTWLTIVHGTLGTVVEGLALYLVFSEGWRIIPRSWRIRNIKRAMRLTLALWTVTVLLGFGIYFYRYLAPSSTTAVETAAVSGLTLDANALLVHADELTRAMARGNDPTVRRHTEHVINLLVGRASPEYGDLDRDGFIEDPGDGTGMLTYLQRVRDQAALANEQQAVRAADAVKLALDRVLDDARAIIGTDDFRSVPAQIQEISTLSDRVTRGTSDSVPQVVREIRVAATRPTVPPTQLAVGTVTVDMENFVYKPRTLQVKPGTTVVFVNKDNAKHTVTDDNGAYNSDDIDAGQTFSFTFTTAGTFPYFCQYHGDRGGVDMAGAIVVAP